MTVIPTSVVALRGRPLSATPPTNGQILRYSGPPVSSWAPQTPTFLELASNPTEMGQVPAWSGTNWVPITPETGVTGDYLPLTGGTLQRASATNENPLLVLRAQDTAQVRFHPLRTTPVPERPDAPDWQVSNDTPYWTLLGERNWVGFEAPDSEGAWFGINNAKPSPWFGCGGGTDHHSVRFNIWGMLQVYQSRASLQPDRLSNRVLDLATDDNKWCSIWHTVHGQATWSVGAKNDGRYVIGREWPTPPTELLSINRSDGFTNVFGLNISGTDLRLGSLQNQSQVQMVYFATGNRQWWTGTRNNGDFFIHNQQQGRTRLLINNDGAIRLDNGLEVFGGWATISHANSPGLYFDGTSNPQYSWLIETNALGGMGFTVWHPTVPGSWERRVLYMNARETMSLSDKFLVVPQAAPISPWPYAFVVDSAYATWTTAIQGPNRQNCEVHMNSPNVRGWGMLIWGDGNGANSGRFGIWVRDPYRVPFSIDPITGNVFTTQGVVHNISDPRVKTILGNYDAGLDAICALQPIRYRFNGKYGRPNDDESIVRHGIDASAVLEVMPEAIGHDISKLDPSDREPTDILTFNSGPVMWAMVNAIKQLKTELDELKGRRRR